MDDDPRMMLIAMNRFTPAIDAEHPLGPELPEKPKNPTMVAIGNLIKRYQDFPLQPSYRGGKVSLTYKGKF